MSSRDALRAAIESRNAAETDFQKTELALARAREALDKEQRELAVYSDVDGALEEHRVGAARDALVAGNDLPMVERLPKYLSDRQTARDAVARRVLTLKGVIQALEKEAETQRAKVIAESIAVELAAEPVAADTALALAKEFELYLTEARRLYLDLLAISRIRVRHTQKDGPALMLYGVAASHRPISLAGEVHQALAQKIMGDWEFYAGAGVGKAAAESADEYWRQLQRSADMIPEVAQL